MFHIRTAIRRIDRTRCLSQSAPAVAAAQGKKLYPVFHAACVPHPDKVEKGGEDSYFACATTNTFAVADGVGGWAAERIDSGKYSKAIMKNIHCEVSKLGSGDLVNVLKKAIDATNAERVKGGTTVVLAAFDAPTRTMNFLNLGDSGIMVIRPSQRNFIFYNSSILFPRLVYRSHDQTSQFNCPFQVSHLDDASAIAALADVVSVKIESGDIVVIATDGLFDNLFDSQIQSIILEHMHQPSDNLSLAQLLAERARDIDRNAVTPFGENAAMEGVRGCEGKKEDDITVVTCSFSEDETEQEQVLSNFETR